MMAINRKMEKTGAPPICLPENQYFSIFFGGWVARKYSIMPLFSYIAESDNDEDYNSRCVVLCDKLEDSQSHLVQSSVHWHLRDSVTVPTNETLFPNGDNVVLGLNGAKNLLI